MPISNSATVTVDHTNVVAVQSQAQEAQNSAGPGTNHNGQVSPVVFLPQSGSSPETFKPNESTHTAVKGRRLQRVVASLTTDDEYDRLIATHQELTRRKFTAEGLSRRERLQLQQCRWAIDRIEDARYGDDLDRLERATSLQERFANEVSAFVARWKVDSRPRK